MILIILSISALRCRLPWGDSLECYSKRYSEWPLDNLDRCPGADSRIHVLNHRIPVLKRWFHDWNRSVTKPPWWYGQSAFIFYCVATAYTRLVENSTVWLTSRFFVGSLISSSMSFFGCCCFVTLFVFRNSLLSLYTKWFYPAVQKSVIRVSENL